LTLPKETQAKLRDYQLNVSKDPKNLEKVTAMLKERSEIVTVSNGRGATRGFNLLSDRVGPLQQDTPLLSSEDLAL
jgi:hypothetical protein